LRLSMANDNDLPLVKSWLTPEMLDLVAVDDLIDPRKPFLIIMIHDEEDRKAGFFHVYNIDFANRKCEIGIVIGHPSNHNVQTKKAVVGLLNWLFKSEGMNRIYIKTLASNRRAIQRASSVGFMMEGIEQEAVLKNGQFEDVAVFALLKKNFTGR
jgi:RimJ/RimL family protein N-acetyltransferase